MYNPFFLFSRRKFKTGLRYASLSSRIFAMTFDAILLLILMTPIVSAISRALFPDIDLNYQVMLLQSTVQQLVHGAMTIQEAWELMLEKGVVVKVLFEHLIQILLSAVAVIWCWQTYNTTPSLAVMGIEIVDAETGGTPTLRQYIIRFLGVVLCMIPFGIGMFWILFTPRNQAWQDLMAGTAVLKKRSWILGKDYPAPEPEEDEADETGRKDDDNETDDSSPEENEKPSPKDKA